MTAENKMRTIELSEFDTQRVCETLGDRADSIRRGVDNLKTKDGKIPWSLASSAAMSLVEADDLDRLADIFN